MSVIHDIEDDANRIAKKGKSILVVLSELSRGGPHENGCKVYDLSDDDPRWVDLADFINRVGNRIKNYVVTEVSHNDLICRWEIKVKEAKNVSK